MSAGTKAVLFCCVALVVVTLILHGNQALDPALPKDMPADSRFMPSGYDLEHNERKGYWVACQPDGTGGNFCRVTDAHGMVIFQGGFLPVKGAQSVTEAGSTPAPGKLQWVDGPSEGAQVPIIPMSDGSVLVPRDDRDALLDRWNQHPEEWQRLEAPQ